MAKLLFITQKVDMDDDTLGFAHGWIKEFAKHFETMTVICLQKGRFDLPNNVEVLSLGKESGASRLGFVFNFYRYLWRERRNYDNVFVHMNPIYMVLGGPFWKVSGKRVILWYIHPAVSNVLKAAVCFTNRVVTATENSFPIKSGKILVVGHGINTDSFKKQDGIEKVKNSMIFVGRVSPVKNLDQIFDAADILKQENFDITLNVVGGVAEKDRNYFNEIKNKYAILEKEGVINFKGSIPNKDMPKVYGSNELLINLTKAGSFDKAILEAMACESLVLTDNSSFTGVLPEEFLAGGDDIRGLTRKIKNIFDMPDSKKGRYGADFRKYVVENHDLGRLAAKIAAAYKGI